MIEFADLFKILSTYGAGGFLLIVLIYIIIKGEISFRYPRSSHGKSNEVER
jgi:hypothetical protein